MQLKVKGLTASTFSIEEATSLSSRGNAAFNAIYLAKHSARDGPIPDGNDMNKLKDFIKSKYEEVMSEKIFSYFLNIYFL